MRHWRRVGKGKRIAALPRKPIRVVAMAADDRLKAAPVEL